MVEDTSMYAGVVYGIHNGDFNYRYIGKTQQTLSRRFAQHVCDAKRRNNPLQCWMRKYEGTVQICVIATFDEDTIHLINEVEQFHIAQNRAYCDNLNVLAGGEGIPFGTKLTEVTRQKMSAARMGDKNPNFGKTVTEVNRKAVGDANRTRVWTPEAIAKRTHTTWHTNKGVFKEGCDLCGE